MGRKYFRYFLILLLFLNEFVFAQSGADKSIKDIVGGKICPDKTCLYTGPVDQCQDKVGNLSECTVCAFCGDGIRELNSYCNPPSTPELCDEGRGSNANSPNHCRINCEIPYCGDRIIDDNNTYTGFPGFNTVLHEICDEGSQNKNIPNHCRTNCVLPYCGDSIIDDLAPYNETCDGNAGCRVSTTAAPCTFCGDGKIQDEATPAEECDNGVSNNNLGTDACRINCMKHYCGDGIKDTGESCDTNDFATDSGIQPSTPAGKICRMTGNANCTFCGDGLLQSSYEDCDPAITEGNRGFNRLCTAQCTIPAEGCGNKTKDGNESCDDGDTNNTNACRNDCTYCGDGELDIADGEQCDPPGSLGQCSATCHNECLYDDCKRACGDPEWGTSCPIPTPTIPTSTPTPCENDIYGRTCRDSCYGVNPPLQESVTMNSKEAVACLMNDYSFEANHIDGNGNVSWDSTLSRNGNVTYDTADFYAFAQRAVALGMDNNDTLSLFAGINNRKLSKSSAGASVCWTCAGLRIDGCFAEGTKILMLGGNYKAIEEIAAGEWVINPAINKGSRVKNLLESPEEISLIEFRVGDFVLNVTQQHPMLTPKGMVLASALKAGDEILIVGGKIHRLDSVKNLPIDPSQKVFNLTLDAGDESFENHTIVAEGFITGDLMVQKKLAKKE